ncbi:hypothetical protein N7510_009524 [Penicillium lagena]|uniref:uncharacterized protein n=1 Tax=Penicillium lagena TaxID=94218 RepID=UPI002540368C|nr:uncharacterized protein N7510_009524 [Penicillium lagena]KAJ5604370.1 hypothetical protein N7510_009524 [Penicillium lagena]
MTFPWLYQLRIIIHQYLELLKDVSITVLLDAACALDDGVAPRLRRISSVYPVSCPVAVLAGADRLFNLPVEWFPSTCSCATGVIWPRLDPLWMFITVPPLKPKESA